LLISGEANLLCGDQRQPVRAGQTWLLPGAAQFWTGYTIGQLGNSPRQIARHSVILPALLKSMLSKYDYWSSGFILRHGYDRLGLPQFIGNTSDIFVGAARCSGDDRCSAFVGQFSAWTFTGAAGKAYQDGPVSWCCICQRARLFCKLCFFSPRFRQMRVSTSIQAVKAAVWHM